MPQQPLHDWQPVPTPAHKPLDGQYVRLEPLDPARHGDDLWQALQGPDSDPALWDYLPYGPFSERAAFDAWLSGHAASRDPLFFSVIDLSQQRAVGLLSYLRIAPKDGCIEIGHIAFGRAMQRSPASTEAVYLLAKLALGELDYRRLEWKCNADNARSMPVPCPRLSAWASATKGCFASIWWSKGVTATPPGLPSSTANGRPATRPLNAGWRRTISMQRGGSSSVCKTCGNSAAVYSISNSPFFSGASASRWRTSSSMRGSSGRYRRTWR